MKLFNLVIPLTCCLCPLAGPAQNTPAALADKLHSSIMQWENLTDREVEGIRQTLNDYRESLWKSKGQVEVPLKLREESFFAAVESAGNGPRQISEFKLCELRAYLGHWLDEFLWRGKPSPAEAARAMDAQVVLLRQLTNDIQKMRSQGVNERDGGTWNVVSYDKAGRRLPPPPHIERANLLNYSKGTQGEIMRQIWTRFMTRDHFRTVEERKQFLTSRGIGEDEYAGLLELLPDSDRTR